MKTILKDVILDFVKLKNIWGCGRSLNSQCCDEGAVVLLGLWRKILNIEKRMDWSPKKKE